MKAMPYEFTRARTHRHMTIGELREVLNQIPREEDDTEVANIEVRLFHQEKMWKKDQCDRIQIGE